jgi:hypothetical protein
MQKEIEENAKNPNFGLDIPFQNSLAGELKKFQKRNYIKNLFTMKTIVGGVKKIVQSHYFWVFVFGLALNAFIFRGVLAAWPNVIANKVIVGPEELVPIFNFQTQFIDQQINPLSELTSNYEFRVRYSILTTWARYYSILPGTIVLFNSITILLIYTAIYRLIKLIDSFQKEKTWLPIIYTSALAGSLLSIFILIYSKITHFYTLIFGFGFFAIAFSLLIEFQIRFSKLSKSQKILGLLIIVLLNLFNPATHYVILFIFIAGIMTIIEVIKIIGLFLKGKKINEIGWGKFTWIFFSMVFSALSYVAYYYFFVTSSNQFAVSDIVNITRRIITNASSSIEQILSLQTGAILDFHNFGDYQIEPGSRIYSSLYSVLFGIAGIIALIKSRSKKQYGEFSIWALLATLWSISIFFALGYNNSISAHNTAGWIAGRLYQSNNLFSSLVFSGISTFFQILRFPHRFIFIFQLVNSIGLSIWLYYALSWLDIKFKIRKSIFRWAWLIVSFCLILTPYLYGNAIGKTLGSGDLNGFIAPYYIPDDLKSIKNYLRKNPGGKMVVMPSTEIPLRVTDDDNGSVFKLIDKFFIYYLDYPSQYYGLGTDTNFKNFFFTIYNQINLDLPWFNQLKNQGIEYILVNKNQHLKTGFNFRNSLEPKILDSLKTITDQGLVTAVVDGSDFSLLRLKPEFVETKTSYYFNDSWKELQETAFRDNIGFENYTLSDISKNICKEDSYVVQSDLAKIIKDLYFMCQKKGAVYNSQILPFKGEIESTDDYSSTVFSLFTTTESPISNRFNTLASINPGAIGSLNKKIIFLTEEDVKINIPFQIENNGNWNIDLRSKITQAEIVATVLKENGDEVKSIKINLSDPKNINDVNGIPIFNNFEYFNLISDLNLNKGKYILSLSRFGKDPIAIDGILPYTNDNLKSFQDSKNIQNIGFNLYKFKNK